jgi:hypothetical protein
VAYLSKFEDDLRLEQGEWTIKLPGKRTDITDWTEDVEDGMDHRNLVRKHPALYMRYMRNCTTMEKIFRPEKKKKIYTGFNIPLQTDFTKPVLLLGPSGIGKSQYAKACLPEALFTRHIDKLVEADLSKGIIFDDMDFTHWPRSSQIHILDNEEDSTIHVRYTTVDIPAETAKIFTANIMPFIHDEAIMRRLTIVDLTDKLY